MTGIFKGRFRVRYNYARYGYTRGGGKTWHGGIDLEALDDKTIYMPAYKGKAIRGTVTRARIVTDKSNKTWEWGYYICVQLDANQTPDAVNFLYFCHCASLLVKAGQKVKSGDALAIMGNSGNAAQADPPYEHCHLEVRATAAGKGLDPTGYAGCPNAIGTYGTAPEGGAETLIDVSYHQGNIDWAQVPYRAILRVGYRGYGNGKLCADEQLTANLTGSRANNKLYGFYFFSQAVTEAEARAEAEFCAGLVPRGYPLFFDAEWSSTAHNGRADKLSKAQRTAIARAFCDRAKALGFQPGVYTCTSFAQSNIDYEGLCASYTGWLADTRTDYNKTLPRSIHQYGQGSVAGIKGDVDMDRVVSTQTATADKPRLQTITIGPVSQGDADAVYAVCKQRGLTAAGLYKSEWTEG